jgi:hypothetical protein
VILWHRYFLCFISCERFEFQRDSSFIFLVRDSTPALNATACRDNNWSDRTCDSESSSVNGLLSGEYKEDAFFLNEDQNDQLC